MAACISFWSMELNCELRHPSVCLHNFTSTLPHHTMANPPPPDFQDMLKEPRILVRINEFLLTEDSLNLRVTSKTLKNAVKDAGRYKGLDARWFRQIIDKFILSSTYEHALWMMQYHLSSYIIQRRPRLVRNILRIFAEIAKKDPIIITATNIWLPVGNDRNERDAARRKAIDSLAKDRLNDERIDDDFIELVKIDRKSVV